MGLEGSLLMVKSVVLESVMGRLKVSVEVPVLLMLKVCTSELPTVELPKSVSSAVLGVVLPSAMVVELPCTSISGKAPVPPMTKL